MERQLTKELDRVLNQFSLYLLSRKIQGDSTRITDIFYEFIRQNYNGFERDLIELSKKQGKSFSALLYEHLPEEKRNLYGPIFQLNSQTIEQETELDSELEKQILNSKELQEYRRDLQPYLNEEQNRVFAEKLGELLYERLDENAKNGTTPQKIVRYILNLGIITISRVSHKEAIGFVMKYSSLFNGERDILNRIAERYIDEELAITPVEKTQQRIRELEEAVKKLYAGVKKDELR